MPSNPSLSLPLSLYGTLTSAIPGLDPFLAAGTAKDEAMSQMEKTALARKNTAAQAFAQLQSATQAPLPQQPAFAPSQFFGDLASIISRRPEFQERAQQSTLAKRGEQLRLRAENLQALRDNYLQAAEQAKEIDPLAAIKYREKVAAQDKALEQINEQMKFARETGAESDKLKAQADLQLRNNLAEIKAKGEQDRLTDKLKLSQSLDDLNLAFQSNVKTTKSGNSFLDASELVGKDKGLAFRWAAANGIPMLGRQAVDKLQRIDIARSNIANMKAQIETLLPKDPSGRFDPRIPISKIFQSPGGGAARAAFNTFRIAAIEQLTALAGGMGSGLRINQAEIITAIQNDIPNVNPGFGKPVDSYETAVRKMDNVLNMLDHTEDPIVQDDWSKLKSTLGKNVSASDSTFSKPTLKEFVR